MTTLDRVRSELASAGCDGWCHAAPVGGDAGIGLGSDSPVVVASMYKLHLLVAASRSVDRGELDPAARVTVEPASSARGPTGFSSFADPVEVSVRDLLRMMIVVSDNAAAERVLGLLPVGAVDEVVSHLGLADTVIRGSESAQLRVVASELGARDWEDAAHLLATDPDADSVHAYDPAYVSHSTPRSLCSVVDAVWTDAAASSGQCAFMREVLGQQVWPHRIASAFPHRSVRVSGKTGTIGRIRAETAVVEPEGETPVAVCVVTRAARAEPVLPVVDAAIGRVARLLVDAVRWGDHQG